MVVLLVLVPELKLLQSGVHHTCDEGHDIVYTPLLSAGGWGSGVAGMVEPPTKFFKRRA